jgi:hypothetical protein
VCEGLKYMLSVLLYKLTKRTGDTEVLTGPVVS